MKLSPNAERALLDQLYKHSLVHFYRKGFRQLKGMSLEMAPYIEATAHALERVFRGEIDRLIVTMPPRCGKSLLCSTVFPVWAMGLDPKIKFMVASYGHDLAREFGDGSRELMWSSFYRALFPDVKIVKGDGSKNLIKLTAGGERRAVSTGGAATGLGAKILIVDDMNKADEGLTPAGQLRAIQTFQNTLSSRFDNPVDGRIVVVQQRLAEGDLVGQLLEMGGWSHLNFPATAEMDETFELGRGQLWHRKKGDLLHPSRLPRAFLEKQLLLQGPRIFHAQYQQDPIAADGGHIRWDWFGQYDAPPARTDLFRVVQTWDTASSDRSTADFSAGQTWGLRGDGSWCLLDVIRKRLPFADLCDRARDWHRRWKADALIIERASTGEALWDHMRRARTPGSLLCPPPNGSKLDRVEGRTAQLAAGKFLLPTSAPWLPDFKRELLAFPDGRNDDQVDALTLFLEFINDWHGWVETRFDRDGNRIRKSRPERRSRYYDGDAPSQTSWSD